MTEVEFKRISAAVVALWPNSAWPEATIGIGFSLLHKFESAHVSKAVANLAREGREFAPPPGVIYVHALAVEQSERPQRPALESHGNWELGRRRIKEILLQIANIAERKQMTTIGRPK